MGALIETTTGRRIHAGWARKVPWLIVILATSITATPGRGGGSRLQWLNLGPFGGEVKALALRPDSLETVYAGTMYAWYGAGVFASADLGGQWVDARDGLPKDTGVLSLLVDPHDPNWMYAGTALVSPGKGVFRSQDAGAHWELANEGIAAGVEAWSLAADPWKPGHILAGTNRGIYTSTDRASTWRKTRIGELSDPSIRGVAFDPSSREIAYAAGLTAFLRSTDGGKNWTRSDDGLPAFPGLLDIEVDPRGNGQLYALSYAKWKVYKSVDRGRHWRGLKRLPDEPTDMDVDRFAPDTLYVTTGGKTVVKTTDGGSTWREVGDGLPKDLASYLGYWDIRASPQRPGTVFLAGSTGVYRSDDSGETWVQANRGIIAHDVREVVVPPSPDGTTYVLSGIYMNRVFATSDGGESWRSSRPCDSRDFTVRMIASDGVDPSVLYAGVLDGESNTYYDLKVSKTTDGGLTWREVFRQRIRRSKYELVDVAVDPLRPDTVYVLITPYESPPGPPAGLYRTLNAGESWSRLSGTPGGTSVSSMAIDPQQTSTIYLTGREENVFRSTDGGFHWSKLSGTVPHEFLNEIVVDPFDSSVLYLRATIDRLYISRDGGSTWERAKDGIPSAQIRDLIADPVDSGVLYAATASQGIFKSTDRGSSWKPVDDDGMKSRLTRCLAIDPLDHHRIFAGTLTTGVWVTVGDDMAAQ